MNTLAVIPARGGSKSIPGKNLKMLNGKPLIWYTIEAAKTCREVNRVVVTTDSWDIYNYCETHCEVYMRPKELGEDSTALAPVIMDVAEKYPSYDTLVTLQPTSPLRTRKDIKYAIYTFQQCKADSLISVTEETHSLWRIDNGTIEPIHYPKVNRQWAEQLYRGNGAIFITKRKTLMEEQDRLGGKIAIYIMGDRESVDINHIEDFQVAELFIKGNI